MCHCPHHKHCWCLIRQFVDKVSEGYYAGGTVGEANPLAIWREILSHRPLDDLHIIRPQLLGPSFVNDWECPKQTALE